MSRDYWSEAVTDSLVDAGVSATAEQIAGIAGDMEVCHENFSMAHGHDVASKNLQASKDDEIESLQQRLRDERDKVVCDECKGRGYIRVNCGFRSSESTCSKCHGDGRV